MLKKWTLSLLATLTLSSLGLAQTDTSSLRTTLYPPTVEGTMLASPALQEKPATPRPPVTMLPPVEESTGKGPPLPHQFQPRS